MAKRHSTARWGYDLHDLACGGGEDKRSVRKARRAIKKCASRADRRHGKRFLSGELE